MSALRYRFGAFTVDVSRACLLHGEAAVPLRPKSFDLLRYLLEHAGRLVGKEELMSALWPDLVVTDDSLTRCISEVRSALSDSSQQMIKTVPRRGYLFDAQVSTVGAAASPAAAAARPRARAAWFAGAAAIVLLVAAAVLSRPSRSPAPPRLSLVVLPFVDQSAGPKPGYLADIITDDLTSSLSRLRGATVIAASSAFSFKGQPVDLRRLGEELQVRYVLQGSVLQGSVLQGGDQVRVSARLAEAASGRVLWSDQFDTGRGDLPATQDDIVARLANALDAELILADSRRVAHLTPGDLEAEDLAMQCDAAAALQQGESGAPSYELCERALQIDPRNVRALVRLALYHGDRVERVQSPDPQHDLARARAWVDRALAVDPRYYGAHCANAVVLANEHHVRDAIVAAERCRALNPSHARAYRILATFHFFLAEPEQTLAYIDRGMRLSPRDHQMAAFLLFKGWALFMMGRDEEALLWLRQAAAAAPESPSVLPPLISVLALTGRDEEAHAALAKYLSFKRTRTRTLAQWDHHPDANEAFERFGARFKSGLRKAGMPEH